jgi:transcriptional regulator with XRE-family HTH domain
MTSKAIGSYLQTLREGRNLTRPYIADVLGVSIRQIQNWERGISDPSGTALLLFMHIVNGSTDQLTHLVLNPDLTAEDGQRLARDWLNRPPVSPHPVEPEPTDICGRMMTEVKNAFWQLAPIILPDPMTRHVYKGNRPNLREGRCIVTVDDQSLHEKLGWENTPNVDFEWGYIGRGPTTLANAILTNEFDQDTANEYQNKFSLDVISALPREKGGIEWVLTNDQIGIWLTMWKIARRELERTTSARNEAGWKPW